MTNEQYRDMIDALIPSYGPFPQTKKKDLVDLAKANPTAILYPATEKETKMILDYLNSRPIVVDFINNPGFCVYKDVAFRVSLDQSQWEIHDKDPDRLCWQLIEYLDRKRVSLAEAKEMNLSGIYKIK